MNTLIQKITKAAVIPASLMITSKIIGFLFANKLFNLEMTVTNLNNGIFPVGVSYKSQSQIYTANNVADIFMLIILFSGVIYYAIKSFYFHNTHTSPKTIIKLSEINLIELISDSTSIYSQLFTWLFYMWITIILCSIDFFNNTLAIEVLIIAIILGTFLTSISFYDVDIEIKNKINKPHYE